METTDPNPNANPESEEDPFYVVKTEAIRTRRPGPDLTADWKDYRKGTRGRRESPEKGRRSAEVTLGGPTPLRSLSECRSRNRIGWKCRGRTGRQEPSAALQFLDE